MIGETAEIPTAKAVASGPAQLIERESAGVSVARIITHSEGNRSRIALRVDGFGITA